MPTAEELTKLARSDPGPEVERLQHSLVRHGFALDTAGSRQPPSLDVDGIVGPNTVRRRATSSG